MEKRIYLSSPHMCGEEMQYIKEAFDTNWVAPLGKNVEMFEKEMCEYIGRPYAVALSSGSAAIHLGLKYLGVEQGDIVFCSSFTFSGSCNSILYLNAKPVFIDSDYESYNMSPEALEKAYELYPNPKAIIIVNLYGQPAKFDELLAIAKKHNTPVLEDSAESLGATYKGRQTGNFGDISIFSFNGNKIITTSGGGMLMCNDKETRDKVLFWATQSREKFPWYQHEEVGYNYRLSNICAGIGRGQMRALDERVAQKRHIHDLYANAFADNPFVDTLPTFDGAGSSYWLTGITLTKDCKASFMDIIRALEVENIESRPAWKPMHTQPIFKGCGFVSQLDKGSVCEDLFNRSMCLPSDTKMSDDEVLFVAKVVNDTIYKIQK
ncbi:MAG: DegT/DnrJ/EryC1/StrS family aminotransferase [Clostridia bacterium]|nr:DegT/DnrJ/EryC1/StrS family aminotransferase [Clostridia bacterium]